MRAPPAPRDQLEVDGDGDRQARVRGSRSAPDSSRITPPARRCRRRSAASERRSPARRPARRPTWRRRSSAATDRHDGVGRRPSCERRPARATSAARCRDRTASRDRRRARRELLAGLAGEAGCRSRPPRGRSPARCRSRRSVRASAPAAVDRPQVARQLHEAAEDRDRSSGSRQSRRWRPSPRSLTRPLAAISRRARARSAWSSISIHASPSTGDQSHWTLARQPLDRVLVVDVDVRPRLRRTRPGSRPAAGRARDRSARQADVLGVALGRRVLGQPREPPVLRRPPSSTPRRRRGRSAHSTADPAPPPAGGRSRPRTARPS